MAFRLTCRNAGGINCSLWLFVLFLLFDSGLMAQRVSNWVAQIQPCDQSSELRKHDHMELSVWLNTTNTALAAEFGRAMNFWAEVLDMAWHESNTPPCSIQVVD